MSMIPLALPCAGFRRGLLGRLPVGPDYIAGVEARARMLAKACQYKGVEDDLLADEKHDGVADHEK